MLTKKNSTKIERIIADFLRRNKIPFKAKVLIGGREVDFLIDNRIILEVDGIIHKEPFKIKKDTEKLLVLIEKGYSIFLRLSAKEARNKNNLINLIKKICL
jgi:very-short-patch-repair endonuclease